MIMITKNSMLLLLLLMTMNAIITTTTIKIAWKLIKKAYNGCNVEFAQLSLCIGRDRIPLLKGYGQALEQKRPTLEWWEWCVERSPAPARRSRHSMFLPSLWQRNRTCIIKALRLMSAGLYVLCLSYFFLFWTL